MAATPLYFISKQGLLAAQEKHPWLTSCGFKAGAHNIALLPGKNGVLAGVAVGIDDSPDLWSIASLPGKLPAGEYAIADAVSPAIATQLCLGWELGRYDFDRYRAPKDHPRVMLQYPANADTAYVSSMLAAYTLARDLINTPPNDMTPVDLASTARTVAAEYGAKISVLDDQQTLEKEYPLLYAVGKASSHAPCLIDMRWGKKNHRKVTLVGKGVCFDTGGLDLKSGSNMRLMKKDMGGAAVVLGLAVAIMRAKLPVCLRVLVPAVENSVAGNAMRPSDIIKSRKGSTVEIGDTDAEGRLILADALFEASREKPDLLIDCATLTGAARVALGTELPALFSNTSDILKNLPDVAASQHDPVWSMPLHAPYRGHLNSKIADICNIPSSGYGGAIAAALFLQEFVEHDVPWLHLDMMAWNLSAKPGRPEGGEAMGVRALFAWISNMVKA